MVSWSRHDLEAHANARALLEAMGELQGGAATWNCPWALHALWGS